MVDDVYNGFPRHNRTGEYQKTLMRKAGSRQFDFLPFISPYIILYQNNHSHVWYYSSMSQQTFLYEAIYSSGPCSPSAWARVGIIWLLVQLFGELFTWSYKSDGASCYCKFPYGHWFLERPKTHHPQPASCGCLWWFTHPNSCDIILPKCDSDVGRCTSRLLPFPITTATCCASPTVLLSSATFCMFSGCWSTAHSTASPRTARNWAQLTNTMAL